MRERCSSCGRPRRAADEWMTELAEKVVEAIRNPDNRGLQFAKISEEKRDSVSILYKETEEPYFEGSPSPYWRLYVREEASRPILRVQLLDNGSIRDQRTLEVPRNWRDIRPRDLYWDWISDELGIILSDNYEEAGQDEGPHHPDMYW